MRISWMVGWGGYSPQKWKDVQTVTQSEPANGVKIGEAYKVYISRQGEHDPEDIGMKDKDYEDLLLPAEYELFQLSMGDFEVQEKKDRIAEIDKILEENERLTDADREVLNKDRVRLLKESETHQDQIYKLWAGKQAIMKDLEAGRITAAEAHEPLVYYEEAIEEAQRNLEKEARRRVELIAEANHQRAKRAAEILAEAVFNPKSKQKESVSYTMLGQKANSKVAQNTLDIVRPSTKGITKSAISLRFYGRARSEIA